MSEDLPLSRIDPADTPLSPEAQARLDALPDAEVTLSGVINTPEMVWLTIIVPGPDTRELESVPIQQALLQGVLTGSARDAALATLRVALGGAVNRLLDQVAGQYQTQVAMAQEPTLDPRTGQPVRICIDANCPSCRWPERWFDTGTSHFGCNQCDYTSYDRYA